MGEVRSGDRDVEVAAASYGSHWMITEECSGEEEEGVMAMVRGERE